jgi:hypothetical protein
LIPLLAEALAADAADLALVTAARTGALVAYNYVAFNPLGQFALGALGLSQFAPEGSFGAAAGDLWNTYNDVLEHGGVDESGSPIQSTPHNPISPSLALPPIAPADDPIGPLPTIPLPTMPVSSYPIVSSSDPNDISGPRGVGAVQYVNDTTPLSYQITFENSPTATAPAQTVEITDQLDPTKVNLATFSLGPITFGNELLTPPAGAPSYSTIVNLQPENDLLVEVNAGLNAATGLVTWSFTSLDPATRKPTTNPLAGFLPPDVNPPEGDGTVYFSVQPNSELATGTQITDSANITFDTNAPMGTSQWLNTIDATTPTSSVAPLPSVEASSPFLVSWSGTDQGSGIASYWIYYSEDGGPWTVWLENTTVTSDYLIILTERQATPTASTASPPTASAMCRRRRQRLRRPPACRRQLSWIPGRRRQTAR